MTARAACGHAGDSSYIMRFALTHTSNLEVWPLKAKTRGVGGDDAHLIVRSHLRSRHSVMLNLALQRRPRQKLRSGETGRKIRCSSQLSARCRGDQTPRVSCEASPLRGGFWGFQRFWLKLFTAALLPNQPAGERHFADFARHLLRGPKGHAYSDWNLLQVHCSRGNGCTT